MSLTVDIHTARGLIWMSTIKYHLSKICTWRENRKRLSCMFMTTPREKDNMPVRGDK